jgi:hypothetical protein
MRRVAESLFRHKDNSTVSRGNAYAIGWEELLWWWIPWDKKNEKDIFTLMN